MKLNYLVIAHKKVKNEMRNRKGNDLQQPRNPIELLCAARYMAAVMRIHIYVLVCNYAWNCQQLQMLRACVCCCGYMHALSYAYGNRNVRTIIFENTHHNFHINNLVTAVS